MNTKILGQGIAVAVGIAIGFFAAASWRGSEAEPPVENPSPRPAKPVATADEQPGDPKEAKQKALEKKQAAERAKYDAYLERHDYSREALIAVALLSHDPKDVIELAERYPDDPQVQLMVIGERDFPGDKSEWYQRFKDSQPDNLFASLLLGSHLLRQEKHAEALEQLRDGASQSGYKDFTKQGALAVEAALIEFGESPLDAKLKGSIQTPLGLTNQVQEGIIALNQLIESGDAADDGEPIALLGVAIGNQLSEGEANRSHINRLFGLGMETNFLKQLEPDLESESLANSPAQMLEEIRTERAQLSQDIDFHLEHFERLDDRQKIHYLDRQQTLGDENAITWLRSQF